MQACVEIVLTLSCFSGLIRKAYEAKKCGKPFEMWGTGKPLRQFLYSRDLGRLLIWALREYDEVESVIMSTDEDMEVSIRAVALMVLRATGFEV